MIRDFQPRLYQETILASASQKNTLVVLPTGMGKTSVALLLAAHRLKVHASGKILILAPTKPLVEQIMSVFQKHLEIPKEKIIMLTGAVSPEKRKAMFDDATVIVSTPQGLENDIISNRISIADVSLLVFDEAHRAVKDYSYVWIAKQYNKLAKFPLILGLTASPGSDATSINEVCSNLSIEGIEVRSDDDPDVKPYIQDVEMKYEEVILPDDFKKVKKHLENCFKKKMDEVKELGAISTGRFNSMSKKDILGAQASLHAEIAHGNKGFDILRSISVLAESLKVQHALELLETQGVSSLLSYMHNIITQSATSKVKAVQNLARDVEFKSALVLSESIKEEGKEHPKLDRLVEIVTEELKVPKAKVIIFNQYRDNAKRIVSAMEAIKGAKPKLFVGQAKKLGTGMSQKEQIQVLDEFRRGEFNVVVMTSVGEEGLDIPAVDSVFFYEPIPSAIRHIQRRGRTGRLEKGKVVVLVTKGTRDEAFRWSAHHKERSMHNVLKKLKLSGGTTLRPQKNLTEYKKKSKDDSLPEFKPKIFIDNREKANPLVKELIELGAEITLKKLDSADYLLSSRVGVEFKTVQDFVDSLLDGRLIQQLKGLKDSFQRPVVIIEGTEDIYSIRNVHPNAIRGLLSTIAVSYGIPLLNTKNYKDTAGLMMIIARREQEEGFKEFSPHASLKPKSLRDQQEYFVSSLPGIGPTLSKPLLRKFKTPKGVVDASVEELQDVELIGKKKAEKLREILDTEYE